MFAKAVKLLDLRRRLILPTGKSASFGGKTSPRKQNIIDKDQILANWGTDSRFVLEANLKSL